MPTGHFRSTGSPMVWVAVATFRFEAVLDTGFEGGLQLPAAWESRLQPILGKAYRELTYQLADGSIIRSFSYLLDIDLDGEVLRVETIFLEGDEILLGVDALRDYRLTIDFPAGTVAVDRAVP